MSMVSSSDLNREEWMSVKPKMQEVLDFANVSMLSVGVCFVIVVCGV